MQCNIEISIDIIKDISNACMEMVKWRLECATTKPYFWASSGFHYATPLTRSWIDETVTNHIQVQVSSSSFILLQPFEIAIQTIYKKQITWNGNNGRSFRDRNPAN